MLRRGVGFLLVVAGWSAAMSVRAEDAPAVRHATPVERRDAWNWSETERFALRSNDDEAASRVRVHGSDQGRLATNGSAAVRPYDMVVGKRDPHLFFRV